MRLPQLFTRALFLLKITSEKRMACGMKSTLIWVVPAAEAPRSSVTRTVAVIVFDWILPPCSNFTVLLSNVAVAEVAFCKEPSVTVHWNWMVEQAEPVPWALRVDVCPYWIDAGFAITLETVGGL